MNETIQKLREYADLQNDWYINKQLDILQKQIALGNYKSRIKTSNRIKQLYKKII